MYHQKPFILFYKYSLPQMVGLLLNSVYLIVDGIFIGNRLGRDAMAAAAVSVPVIEILIALALFVSSGAGILISSKFGSGEAKEGNRIFNLSVVILAIISVVIAVFGNIFLHPLTTFLGATPDIHNNAVTYLWYIVSFSPFLLFSFLLSNLARNDNRPKLAMISLIVGSASNIVLDYVFMYPLNMGIMGAALATALGPIFSVLIVVPHFMRKSSTLHFAKPIESKRYIRQIVTLGFPTFIMEFTIGIVALAYNCAIVSYGFGEIGLAAYLIIGYMLLILLTLFLGMAQGLQPVFSYFDGAKERNRSNALLAFSKTVVIVIGGMAYVLIVLFSHKFSALFVSGDQELISFTSGKMPYYFSGMVFAGYNILMISYWQSIKQAYKALLLSLLRGVIILPLLLTALPCFFGNEVIWTCHSITEVLCGCGVAGYYLLQKVHTANHNCAPLVDVVYARKSEKRYNRR